MNLIELKQELKEFFPEINWTLPSDLKFGILTTNQAFIEFSKLSKEEKQEKNIQNPVDIAKILMAEIENKNLELNLPIKIENKGPYLNLSLDFEKLDFEPKNYLKGLKLKPKPENILLEFVSPNVGKPLHAGHILQANFGESFRKIFSLKYNNLITNSHWCDWGVPLGIMIWSWKNLQNKTVKVSINGQEEDLDLKNFDINSIDSLVKMYVWGNQMKEKVENWDQEVRDEVRGLEDGNSQNLALKQKFFEISSDNCHQILKDLNIRIHDLEQGESFYEKDVKILIDFFEKHNLWEKEGQGRFIDLENLEALWQDKPVELRGKLKNFGRCYLIQSKDGYTTYALRDIAARLQWARDIQADFMITMVGNEQKHHFNQFFAITGYLASLPEFENFVGKEVANRMRWQNLKVIHNGFLTLPDGKMSARKGNFITARDILNMVKKEARKILIEKNYETQDEQKTIEKSQKVGIAAMKWFNLNRDISQDSVLDLDAIMSFEGNTGVYQLYTLARLNSILEKNDFQPESFKKQDGENIGLGETKNTLETNFLNKTELAILNQIYTFEEVLESVINNYKPHILCNYLFEISTAVNSWYAKYSVSTETHEERKKQLLEFCSFLKNHLMFGLDLLGIDGVEKL
jgi:arginyl-tRNA synthetase